MAAKKETTKKTEEKKQPAKKKAEKKESFKKFKAQVVYGSLNVRQYPEIKEGNIVKTLPVKTMVEILGEQDGWYKIKEGWIMKKYTDIVEE